jgi:hypothetical protein
MELDFILKEIGDCQEADEETLRYRVALGDIVLKDDTADFSTSWGWIPLIDFVASIRHSIQELRTTGKAQTFEFTESDAWIKLSPKNGQVAVSASYAPGEMVVSAESFEKAVQSLGHHLRETLVKRRKALESNPIFRRLLE